MCLLMSNVYHAEKENEGGNNKRHGPKTSIFLLMSKVCCTTNHAEGDDSSHGLKSTTFPLMIAAVSARGVEEFATVTKQYSDDNSGE